MTTPRTCPRGRTERGAASVEIALLAPVVLLVVAVMVGGGRVWLARSAVTDAAQSTARAATLENNAGLAQTRARAVGAAALEDVPCARHSIAVDTAGFGVPVGNPANVTARVSCVVDLADLVGFGLPGSLTVEASAVSALDTYRRRR